MEELFRTFGLEDQQLYQGRRRKKYEEIPKEKRRGLHWGHRKLFLEELAFLTYFWDPKTVPNPVVIYAGAAPGDHIPLMSALFPEMTFHCYDPREFSIKSTDKINLYQQYFTIDDAHFWSGRDNIFFISDIRSADHKKNIKMHGLEEGMVITEMQIWKDKSMQQEWIEIIKPVQASLKFRLPYPDTWEKAVTKYTELLDKENLQYDKERPTILRYFKGRCFIQPYAPQTSTETRLIPSKDSLGNYIYAEWDALEYEEMMFYHNTKEREDFRYYNPLTGDDTPIDYPELLNDYDSVYEAHIFMYYLIKRENRFDPRDVIALSRYLTEAINDTEKWETKMTLDFLRGLEVKSVMDYGMKLKEEKRKAPRKGFGRGKGQTKRTQTKDEERRLEAERGKASRKEETGEKALAKEESQDVNEVKKTKKKKVFGTEKSTGRETLKIRIKDEDKKELSRMTFVPRIKKTSTE
jgi:Poly A polymerase regulatory subunit.